MCSDTADNAALIFVDYQVDLTTRVRDSSTGELKYNVVALAKAAKALNRPIVATTTARDTMWGPTFPQRVAVLPGIEIIDRSAVNAYDERVAKAIAATGRKKLIFAGMSLAVCAAFPAMTAVTLELDAYVAVDASGTFSDSSSLKTTGSHSPVPSTAHSMPWARPVGQIASAYEAWCRRRVIDTGLTTPRYRRAAGAC